MKRYKVTLTTEERCELRDLIAAGKAAAKKLARADLAEGRCLSGRPCLDRPTHRRGGRSWRRLPSSGSASARGGGLGGSLGPQEAGPTQPRAQLDGRAELALIALACSAPPAGRRQWTLQLLADQLVELEVVDAVCDETVRRVLKNEIKPWLKEQWCIPPEADAEFVCAMEDVLEVYHRPYDERRPLVCLDEASKQLIGETVQPLPAEPGQAERFDYEYVRNGTANLFMISEPLLGWRHVEVTQRRTAKDFAEVLRLAGRGSAPRRRQGRVGDGQPQHPQIGIAVRGVPARPGTPHR